MGLPGNEALARVVGGVASRGVVAALDGISVRELAAAYHRQLDHILASGQQRLHNVLICGGRQLIDGRWRRI